MQSPTILEYIWWEKDSLKSFTHILYKNLKVCPEVNLDNSKILTAVKTFFDPFRLNQNQLVLCNLCKEDSQKRVILEDSRTVLLNSLTEKNNENKFCIKTEVYIKKNTKLFINIHGIVDKFIQYCLYAGIRLSNIYILDNGQFRYEIGCLDKISTIDEVLISRYILTKLCRLEHLEADFSKNPLGLNYKENSGYQYNENLYQQVLKELFEDK